MIIALQNFVVSLIHQQESAIGTPAESFFNIKVFFPILLFFNIYLGDHITFFIFVLLK